MNAELGLVLAIAIETLIAVVVILSIGAVNAVHERILGRGAKVLGVPLSIFFDIGHIVVLIMWVVRCANTAMEHVA